MSGERERTPSDALSSELSNLSDPPTPPPTPIQPRPHFLGNQECPDLVGGEAHAQHSRLVGEVQPIVGLIAIPDAGARPLAVDIAALFDAGENEAIDLSSLGRREIHAHMLTRQQKLVGTELREQCTA